MDIDIILDISNDAAQSFVAVFEKDYYVQLSSLQRAILHRKMFNVISLTTSFKVDCIVRKDTPLEIAKFERRQRDRIGDIEFWVISKLDLILSKLEWARESHSERQFEDIRNLIESGVDKEALSESTDREKLENVWQAFEEWKIRIAK